MKVRPTCTQEATLFVVTEVVRWAIIILVIYLSVWQYSSVHGYAIFVPGADLLAQFWGVFTAIMVGISLVVYLPWRILSVKLRQKYNIIRDERWYDLRGMSNETKLFIKR